MTREQEIIKFIKEKNGRTFTVAEAHNAFSCRSLDISRVYSILKILILKGIVIRISKGVYQEIKKGDPK